MAAKKPILLPQVVMSANADNQSVTSNADILRAAMDAQGITNNQTRAGIAAIVTGETSFVFKPEIGYSHTNNDRIRSIFGSRVMGLTDDMLAALKADDVKFFEQVYGGAWGAKNLGNTHPGDGYKYRGRGPIQLTGLGNYVRYGKLCGHPEIVDTPDVLNTPAIGCAMTVAYIKDRYRGNGWEGLKASVGNSFGTVDDIKNAAYARFLASGEYNYNGAPSAPITGPVATSPVDPVKPTAPPPAKPVSATDQAAPLPVVVPDDSEAEAGSEAVADALNAAEIKTL